MDYMVLFFGIFYQFVFRPVFGNGAGEPIKQKLE
jgi:hypothetical protein